MRWNFIYSGPIPNGSDADGVVKEVGVDRSAVADVVLSPEVEGQEGLALEEGAEGSGAVARFSYRGSEVGA